MERAPDRHYGTYKPLDKHMDLQARMMRLAGIHRLRAEIDDRIAAEHRSISRELEEAARLARAQTTGR